MARHVLVLLQIALVAACQPEEILFLPQPSDPTIRSLAIVVEGPSGDIVSIEARPNPFEEPVRVKDHDVTMLGYRTSLEDLGLSAGPLPTGERDCRLAFPDLSVKARLGTQGGIEWRNIEKLSAALRLSLTGGAECADCVTIEVTQVPVAPRGQIYAAAPLTSGAALVSLAGPDDEDVLFRVDQTDATLIAGCEHAAEAFLPLGSNRFWTGDGLGEFRLIEIDRSESGCTVTTSTRGPEMGMAKVLRAIARS